MKPKENKQAKNNNNQIQIKLLIVVAVRMCSVWLKLKFIMKKLLDFEKDEKGYKEFYPSRENIKNNIGKRICYVNRVDPHRGYYNVLYGIIHSIRYSTLYLNDMDREVDIRDIKQAGILIENE